LAKKNLSARLYRRLLVKEHSHKYKKIVGKGADVCFYCNDTATDLDHVPSLGYADALDVMRREVKIRYVLLRSCRQCNNRLNNRPIFTVSERAQWLEVKLSAEYERRFALWSEDEIHCMGKDFQRMIRARKDQLTFMLERIRALQQCSISGDTLIEIEMDDDL
jgi:hypothetical protein